MRPRLLLLRKPGCPLCDEAVADLARVAPDYGLGWAEVDVTDPASEWEAYADRLPVLLLDGREHSFWRIDEHRLRRDLDRSAST